MAPFKDAGGADLSIHSPRDGEVRFVGQSIQLEYRGVGPTFMHDSITRSMIRKNMIGLLKMNEAACKAAPEFDTNNDGMQV